MMSGPKARRWAPAVVAALAVSGCGEPGALSPAGSAARDIGGLTLLLLVAGGTVFVAVLVVLAVASRGTRGEPDDVAAARSRRLVLGGGVVLPLVVLVPLTIVMLLVGRELSHRVGGADLEVEVIGHQYWWEVRYPAHGVVTANEIHVPAGQTIRLTLTSEDVIHSFWAPQLAGKIDLIPGKTTELRFDVDEPGSYQGYCAEFCGIQHGRMRFLVIGQTPDEFAGWLEEQSRPAAEAGERAAAGAEVFSAYGCGECHTVRGTGAEGTLGPDLTHLASRRTLGAGTLENGRGQLAGWVANPQHVKPGNHMPPTPLGSEELLALLDYLEGLE